MPPVASTKVLAATIIDLADSVLNSIESTRWLVSLVLNDVAGGVEIDAHVRCRRQLVAVTAAEIRRRAELEPACHQRFLETQALLAAIMTAGVGMLFGNLAK